MEMTGGAGEKESLWEKRRNSSCYGVSRITSNKRCGS